MCMRTWLRMAPLAVCGFLLAGPAFGATLEYQYHAGPETNNSTPNSVWTPTQWGWYGPNVGALGVGVVDPLNTGMNAWRVTKLTTAQANPLYHYAPNATTAANAVNKGWRLWAYLHYVSDLSSGPTMGLSAFLGGRAYVVGLDLSAGDLYTTLHGAAGTTRVTAGSTGNDAFHLLEIEKLPGTNAATVRFDGSVLSSSWVGVGAAGHENVVSWGSQYAAPAIVDFQDVEFEIGPFTAATTADFDGDRDADGTDFLRWQRTLGAATTGSADGNHDGVVNGADLSVWKSGFGKPVTATTVPEPGTVGLVGSAVAMLLVAPRRAVSSRLLRRILSCRCA